MYSDDDRGTQISAMNDEIKAKASFPLSICLSRDVNDVQTIVSPSRGANCLPRTTARCKSPKQFDGN